MELADLVLAEIARSFAIRGRVLMVAPKASPLLAAGTSIEAIRRFP